MYISSQNSLIIFIQIALCRLAAFHLGLLPPPCLASTTPGFLLAILACFLACFSRSSCSCLYCTFAMRASRRPCTTGWLGSYSSISSTFFCGYFFFFLTTFFTLALGKSSELSKEPCRAEFEAICEAAAGNCLGLVLSTTSAAVIVAQLRSLFNCERLDGFDCSAETEASRAWAGSSSGKSFQGTFFRACQTG